VVVFAPAIGLRPTKIQSKLDFWTTHIRLYVEELKKRNKKPIIMAGDFNIAPSEKDEYSVFNNN
jgi:exonuclease III